MGKKLYLTLLIVLFIGGSLQAATIFSERFSDGDADGWTVPSGYTPWTVEDVGLDPNGNTEYVYRIIDPSYTVTMRPDRNVGDAWTYDVDILPTVHTNGTDSTFGGIYLSENPDNPRGNYIAAWIWINANGVHMNVQIHGQTVAWEGTWMPVYTPDTWYHLKVWREEGANVVNAAIYEGEDLITSAVSGDLTTKLGQCFSPGLGTVQAIQGYDFDNIIIRTPYDNAPPIVNAGVDQVIKWADTHSATLDALVTDDGSPGPLSYQWERISGPNSVTFDTPNAEDTIANFGEPARYELKLTATDGQYPISDTMEVYIPLCQDLINDGLGQSADIYGPEGARDCKVDLYDVASMASQWIECVDPNDASCAWLY